MTTQRLMITEFDLSFAPSVHWLSVEASNRKALPDEVFETVEDARVCIASLMDAYSGKTGPYVYPLLRKSDGAHIGHVEAGAIGPGSWEIGYHIGEAYRNQGYATEAVTAFTPWILKKLGTTLIYGICCAENTASARVLEKSGYLLTEETCGLFQGIHRQIRRYIYNFPYAHDTV